MSTEKFTPDVFLSHSAKDQAVVCPLAEPLVAVRKHLKVRFDEWVLKPGDLNQGMRSSRRESAQTSIRPDQCMSGLTSTATKQEEIEHSQFGLRVCATQPVVQCVRLGRGAFGGRHVWEGQLAVTDPLNQARSFMSQFQPLAFSLQPFPAAVSGRTRLPTAVMVNKRYADLAPAVNETNSTDT